jgi:L-2,4-diaminobutyric acid acetyltransferase
VQSLKEAVSVRLRKPEPQDGANIWRLVRESNKLDLNSSYCYLLLSEYFADTCVVAENDGNIIGFVSAFRLPSQSSVIFVWQIAVSEKYRGHGIGSALLHALLSRDDCADVQYIEATISPSNEASRALFTKISRNLTAPCKVSEGFRDHLFPGIAHEAELLYRIGPITSSRMNKLEVKSL